MSSVNVVERLYIRELLYCDGIWVPIERGLFADLALIAREKYLEVPANDWRSSGRISAAI
jgi:hypothetical protein